MLDTKKRTVMKTLTDKAMEIILSAIIIKVLGLLLGLNFSNEFVLGLPLLIEVLQIAIYILNERIWSKIQWECSHEGHICETCKVPTCKCPYGKHEEE